MDKRILEGIESCRPGSQDVLGPEVQEVARLIDSDPAVREAYARVQRSDAVIAAAMDRVALPPGLAERLLDRMRAAHAQIESPLLNGVVVAASEGVAVNQSPASVELAQPRGAAGKAFSRRRALVIGSSVVTALAVLAATGLLLRPNSPIPLETRAEEWVRQLGSKWQPVAQAPQDFPLPAGILASPTVWQRFGNMATGRGVAYQLQHAQAGKAMLLVVKLTGVGAPTSPPVSPQSTTGGKAIAYWCSGGLLYVLVVEGGERSYRSFVSPAPVPLA